MYFETELIALKIRQLISREMFSPSRKSRLQINQQSILEFPIFIGLL